MRRYWFTLVVVLVAAQPAPADMFSIIDVASEADLAVVDRELRVGSSPPGKGCDWGLSPKWDKPQNIQMVAPGFSKGMYLAYYPEGKGKDRGHVFLGTRRGPDTKWLVKPAKFGSAQYTIRAASGKVKGWYLAPGGKGVHLVEKPEELPLWTICNISP